MTFLEDSFNRLNVRHFNDFGQFDKFIHSFVVIAGQHQLPYVANLNADLARFEKVILCIVGDEENLFPFREIKHPNIKFIIQTPKPRVHDDCEKLLVGYSSFDLKNLINSFPSGYSFEREHDWFFAGQVNHNRRKECVEVLRRLSKGMLLETAGFTQGMPQGLYFLNMLKSKIIPCPSGVCSPDSFRFAEALECGCVPVVDGKSPKAGYEGFWEYVLGEKPPFPIIQDWREFPDILQEQLKLWPDNARHCSQWWDNYKFQFSQRLADLFYE